MEKIPATELSITPLNKGIDLNAFDCGDADLNEFLKHDSFVYEEKCLVKTFICLHQNKPVGFFSICADAIRLNKDEQLTAFGQPKMHADYPALKIARLAVTKDCQHCGIGEHMVKAVIGRAISLSEEIGCRFVTVDAYSVQTGFYAKLRFISNLEDKSGQNKSMRLDLIQTSKNA